MTTPAIGMERTAPISSRNERAKAAKAALTRAFPGVRFSVRQHIVSSGVTLSIYWVEALPGLGSDVTRERAAVDHALRPLIGPGTGISAAWEWRRP